MVAVRAVAMYVELTSPIMEDPPDGAMYHRYCPGNPPEAVSAIFVPKQPEVLITVGPVGHAKTIKSLALVAVFDRIETVIFPFVAPVGTKVVMFVVVPFVTGASLPLNLTILLAKTGSKLVPVIVTTVPVTPLVGVKEEMVGGGMNVNPESVPFPPGVVTITFPEVPTATIAVRLVAETTLIVVADVPPKLTSVVPIKLVPVILTNVPVTPLVGVKEEMVGAGIKVKPVRASVPPVVVTETFPVLPPSTSAIIVVAETKVKDVAVVPPKLTAVAPIKLVPVMVTVVPFPPLVGVNEVMVGGPK